MDWFGNGLFGDSSDDKQEMDVSKWQHLIDYTDSRREGDGKYRIDVSEKVKALGAHLTQTLIKAAGDSVIFMLQRQIPVDKIFESSERGLIDAVSEKDGLQFNVSALVEEEPNKTLEIGTLYKDLLNYCIMALYTNNDPDHEVVAVNMIRLSAMILGEEY